MVVPIVGGILAHAVIDALLFKPHAISLTVSKSMPEWTEFGRSSSMAYLSDVIQINLDDTAFILFGPLRLAVLADP